MDRSYRGAAKLDKDILDQALGQHHDLFETRYKHSFIGLLDDEGLPNVPRVSSFHVNAIQERNIEPRSIALIAPKFNNLRSIDWECRDNEKRHPHLRQQARYGTFLRSRTLKREKL